MEKKTFEELTFTDDFMFCKILQNNEGLCKELLELILGKRITKISYPEKQKTIEITSDYFGQGLHKYSFENICKEMPKLRLKDETEKIFLCAAGTKNDVSKEMQDFLNYLTGREVVSSLAQRLEREVDRARKHEEWRQEISLKQRGSG